MSEQCHICGEDNSNVLQIHHIIPRRMGGADEPSNLVTLCANCHQAIEQIYTDAVFKRLKGEDPARLPERAEQPVRAFADACLEPDPNAVVEKTAVRDEFNRWVDETGHPTIHPSVFGRALLSLERFDINKQRVRKNGKRKHVYRGVVIKR